MRRTLAALLALGSASALRVSLPEHGPAGRRRALLTAGAAAAGATLLVGPPRAALADRGKDLYTSDQEVLSGVRGKDFGESQVDVLPEFDADGKLVVRNGVVEDTQYRTVKSGPAAVRMLRNWEQAGDGLNDPVTGSAAELFRIASYDTSLKSIADLGPPERVKVLDLGLEKEMRRADMVAAAVRNVDGVRIYEYDLALPALKCGRELATACPPERVVLLAAGVTNGQLVVLRVDADPAQWRRSGTALRSLRSTLALAARE